MLRLVLVIGLWMLAMSHAAAQSGQAWEFCSNHGVSGIKACFGSLEEAESWMRQDNAASSRGRKFLEQVEVSGTNWTNNSPKSYIYRVRSRPGKLTGQEYAKLYEFTSFGGNSDWVCHCDNGVPTCRGGYGDCGPGQCQGCPINNGDLSILKEVLSRDTGAPGSACNVTFTSESGWPSPPLSAGRMSTYPDGSGPTASNVGAYEFGNGYGGYDGVFAGFDPRSVYNKTFVRNFGARNSQGVCTGNYREKAVAWREQVFECEAGLVPVTIKLNAQGGYIPAPQVGSMDSVCASNESGIVETRLVPTRECPYNNPCVPATGAKIQREEDFKQGLLEFSRYYNSIRLKLSNLMMGPSWNHQYSERVYAPNSSHILHVADDGNVERFDAGAEVGGYYSVNEYGSVLRKVGTTGWELRTGDGLLKSFNTQGQLTAIERLGDASSRLTMSFAASQGMDTSLQGNPAGVLERVTDSMGRSLKFYYGVMNTVVGSGAVSFDPCVDSADLATCRGRRLLAVELPDGSVITYGYGLNGEPTVVEYPDGTSRNYHYNESENICPVGANGCPATPPAGGFPHALTGISEKSATGVVNRFATFQFDHKGRAISTSHAGGVDRLMIEYDTTGTGAESATLSFAEGKQLVLEISPRSGIFRKPSSRVEMADGQSVPTLISYASASSAWVGSTTDGRGNRTDTSYPTLLRVVRKDALTTAGVVTAQTRTIDTTRDASTGQPSQETTYDSSGAAVAMRTWLRNSRGQLISLSSKDMATGEIRATTFSYCEQADVDSGACPVIGLQTSVDDRRTDVADVTEYQYYATDHADCAVSPTTCAWRKGDLWKVTNALGQVTETLRYDGAGRVLSVKDANGVVTDFEYHPRGWMTARKVRGADGASEADGQITRIAYYPTGLVSSTTLPDGSFTSYVYDAAHRLTDIVDADGNRIHYTLDSAGNRTREEVKGSDDSLKRTLSRVYNQLGQLQAAKDASNHPTGFAYDANGNTDTVTDVLGRVTDNDYDPLNRLSKTIQDVAGIAATTQFKYDAQDHLTEVVDPKGLSTKYHYNAFGDLTRLESPDTGVATYGYDAAGNRISALDARGEATTYSYDALNRLTAIGYSDTALNVGYTYDAVQPDCTAGETFAASRLTRMTDGSGATRYCYDRFGNLTRKVQTTNGQSFTLRYAYTKAGQLAGIEYPDGAQVDYVRDGLGRATEVGVTPSGGSRQVLLTGASYHPFGPVAGWMFGNGRTLSRTLDLDYRPKTILSTGTGAGGLNLGFGWDAVGNVASLHTSGLEQPPRVSFDYDALNRLTAFRDGPAGAAIEQYAYDATGNRISFTSAGGTEAYTYPADSHRLTAVGATARTYDAMGNTTSIGGTAREFANNAAGRMSEVQRDNVVAMQYAYNGRGEQVRKHLDTGNTYTMYDESGQWIGDYGSTGAPTQQVVWLDSLPIGLIANGQLRYIEADHLGTPRAVIEPQRDVAVWTWDITSEAFGNSAPSQDPDGDSAAFLLDMRYPGQRYDAASGLNYNYFRDYEPGSGRYVESDPSGLVDGPSTYGYVRQNPLALIDSHGNSARPGPGYSFDNHKELARAEAIAKMQQCNLGGECEGSDPYAVSEIDRSKVINKLISADIALDYTETNCGATEPNLGPNTITIGGGIFSGRCCSMAAVLAHEAMHLVSGDPFSTKTEGQARNIQLRCFNCSTAYH
ncbi:RHS repeat-associated core domain-containing protein [Lysobacter cavernae]|uniref:RHS repeat-associated core domain-containing protein n=1 Tax=Lysobacter cavernae TaxID=1685901 RepID=A0ABV7RNW4_9GAMM